MLLRVFYSFIQMVYSKTPSATVCIYNVHIYNQVAGNLMTNEQDRMCKEAVVANWYNIQDLSWRDFGKPRTACRKQFGRGWNGADNVNALDSMASINHFIIQLMHNVKYVEWIETY